MTLETLIQISRLPALGDPRTFGRDYSNPYYDFLANLVQALPAQNVLELGTCTGSSTSYLAAASDSCQILTVDIAPQPWAKERLSIFPNVELLIGSTTDPNIVDRIRSRAPFDLIFFDTLHVYEQVSAEWKLYRSMLRQGGVALFDDISLDEGMSRFWSEVDVPKCDLKHLHWSGFGAAIP